VQPLKDVTRHHAKHRLHGARSDVQSYSAVESPSHPETWLGWPRKEMRITKHQDFQFVGSSGVFIERERTLQGLPGLLLDIVDKWRWNRKGNRSIPSQDPTLFCLSNWKFLLSCLLVTHTPYVDVSVRIDEGDAWVVSNPGNRRNIPNSLVSELCCRWTFPFRYRKIKYHGPSPLKQTVTRLEARKVIFFCLSTNLMMQGLSWKIYSCSAGQWIPFFLT
jgi:hypothetical protein